MYLTFFIFSFGQGYFIDYLVEGTHNVACFLSFFLHDNVDTPINEEMTTVRLLACGMSTKRFQKTVIFKTIKDNSNTVVPDSTFGQLHVNSFGCTT